MHLRGLIVELCSTSTAWIGERLLGVLGARIVVHLQKAIATSSGTMLSGRSLVYMHNLYHLLVTLERVLLANKWIRPSVYPRT